MKKIILIAMLAMGLFGTTSSFAQQLPSEKKANKVEKKEEKIGAIGHRRIPIVEEEKFKLTIQDSSLTIDMPEDAFYIEHVEIYKRGIATDMQKFVPDLTEVKFVETFKSEPKPATPTAIPTPAPTPQPEEKTTP